MFTRVGQCGFTGTRAIALFSYAREVKPKDVGNSPSTKHSKARAVCIILGRNLRK